MEAMKRAPWNTRVMHIMVDEAHCVVQWGEGFRKAYREIYNLTAIFMKSSPTVVAVTATASPMMQKEILRILDIEDAATIVGETDRSNIKLSVSRRQSHTGRERTAESSYTAVFMPLIKELKTLKDFYPKTVVYTSLKWCGFGNELGVRYLSDGRVESTGVPSISQYHAPLSSEVCVDIYWVLKVGASTIQVLSLSKVITMNILKTWYSSGTTRVPIFHYSYSYVQYSPQPCICFPDENLDEIITYHIWHYKIY